MTLRDCVIDVFVAYAIFQLQHVDRRDIVLDLHTADSLKADICYRRRKAEDELSYQVQFLKSGKDISASTTTK